MTGNSKSLDQIGIWKENLRKLQAEERAKEERIQKMMKSGEMYNKMVSEAVGLITAKITEDSKNKYLPVISDEGVAIIGIYSVLVITPELQLYTGCWSVPKNPETRVQYFFELYRFNNEEEIKRFFEDVKAQLPKEVKFREREAGPSDHHINGSRIYDVRVEIDLNN